MCKNGTLTANPSKVDDDCALSVTINDQVVVRKSDSKNKDIELMLQEFDDRFAVQTHTAFKVFDVFARGYNLIFKVGSTCSIFKYYKELRLRTRQWAWKLHPSHLISMLRGS